MNVLTTTLRLGRRGLDVALDIIFPRSCLLCRSGVDDPFFCPGCRKLLRCEMARPACPRCAHSTGPFGVQDGRCHACRHASPHLDHLVRAGPYGDATASLVRAFKYGGRDEIDAYLGELLGEVIRIAPWFESTGALVCVPTHWRHSIGRAFYAPGILARMVSRTTGIPLVRLLRRTAGGRHQLDVPRSDRHDNIRGKFAMMPGTCVRGAGICLIDDVSTTGATLNECAKILKQDGAAAVYGAVIAKVDTSVYVHDGV